MIRIAKTELSEIIATPAFYLSIRQKRARVPSAGADLRHRNAQAQTQFDNGKSLSHFIRFVAASIRIALPKLSILIVAPAFHGSVGQERARMHRARADVLDDDSWRQVEVDCGKARAHFIGVVAAVVFIAEAKLSEIVVAPAFDRNRGQAHAGMSITGADQRGTRAQVDREKIRAHFVGLIAAGFSVA